MGSTCNQLLERCLRGERWTEALLRAALEEDNGRAFLSVVVERLGDLFEPRLCDVYAELFAQAIRIVYPDLLPRLRRAKAPGPAPELVERVYVLSRITLGADIAVTSVILNAVQKRYPGAEIIFVGPRKNFELFEGDGRTRFQEAPYPRTSSLQDRLAATAALNLTDGIVFDPDSRLTQLGLVRVCPDERYFFFDSRSYGAATEHPLPALTAAWVGDLLGVESRPYVAPLECPGEPAVITVSLGVGENPAKRLSEDFERELMIELADTGFPVLVDTGAGGEERERVRRAIAGLPSIRPHEGSFASFVSRISRSRVFIGYDSAAGHAASAGAAAVISIAKGFVSPRMQARWRPLNATVIDGDAPDVLEQVREALTCTFRR